jgi:hypothetical protein
MTKNLSFKYASLNCNSLVKKSKPATQSSFIRYLRLQQFDILSLQETHASDTTIPSLNMHLQAKQTFWTEHCGIVSFSPSYVISQISTNHIYMHLSDSYYVKFNTLINFMHPFIYSTFMLRLHLTFNEEPSFNQY